MNCLQQVFTKGHYACGVQEIRLQAVKVNVLMKANHVQSGQKLTACFKV